MKKQTKNKTKIIKTHTPLDFENGREISRNLSIKFI